jgi:hypothetical protein
VLTVRGADGLLSATWKRGWLTDWRVPPPPCSPLPASQDGLNQLQATARQLQLAAAAGPAGGRAAAEQLLSEAARQLAATVAEMWQRARTARLRGAARALSLQEQQYPLRYTGGGPLIPSPPPAAPLAGAGGQQGAAVAAGDAAAAAAAPPAGAKRQYLYFAFPPAPLPPRLRAPLAGPGTAAAPGARAAALSFVLAVQFPPADARRFWLLVGARDASGLPGPVFARLPVPAAPAPAQQQQQQQQEGEGAPPKGAEGLGKRKRSEDGPAAADAPQQQQQAQEAASVALQPPAAPLPPPGWQQDAAVIQELGAAVGWSRRRMTHERLLFELSALGVPCQELQPQAAGGGAAADAGAAPPPGALRLRLAGAVGGERLGAPRARRPGAAAAGEAAAVGIDEVVLCAREEGADASGAWSLHVRGALYAGFGAAPAGAAEEDATAGPRGGGWARHDFSYASGRHAGDAMLRVLRVLRTQRLLCQLERLARGGQRLAVRSGIVVVGGGKENAAGEANGEARPAKKPKVVGGGAANGAAAGNGGDGSGGGGLSWHWPGSGSVRLVGGGDTWVALECGAPLPEPPSVAGGGAAAAAAAAGAADGGPGGAPRLRLEFTWDVADGDSGGGTEGSGDGGGDALRLRCRVRCAGGGPGGAALEPALQALGEMADAGEEAALLDALGICGWPLAAAAAALAPGALAAAGVRPRGVSAHGRGSPYQLRLLVAAALAPPGGSKADGKADGSGGGGNDAAAAAAAAVDLRFATGGRVCITIADRAAAAGTAGAGGGKPSPQKQPPPGGALPSLLSPPAPPAPGPLARLAEALPGVKLVADPSGAPGAVWVHAAALPAALPAALALARDRSGGGGGGAAEA